MECVKIYNELVYRKRVKSRTYRERGIVFRGEESER